MDVARQARRAGPRVAEEQMMSEGGTDERHEGGQRTLPLATENQAMPQDEGVSESGETRAKEREVAREAERDEESGGVAEQQAYLRREARIGEEEREEE
jgi:hypothetical protein